MLNDDQMDELITKMAQLASDTDESIVGISLVVDCGFNEERQATRFELVITGRMSYKDNIQLLHDLACLRLDIMEEMERNGETLNIPTSYLPVVDKRKQN